MRLMLQIQHVQPARQPDRPRRRLSQRLPAQKQPQQRPLRHQKVLPLQSPQKARRPPVPCRENVRNECGSVTRSAATSASTATTKASEAATSARDAAASKEAAKSSETSAASSAGSAASSATAAGNSAKAAKTSETNARSSETAAEPVPPQQQAQKLPLHHRPVRRQLKRRRPQPVPPPPENRQKAPHRPLQQPQRRLAKPLNRPLQQRGLLPLRGHPRRTRKRRKPVQNLQKRLPHRPPVRRHHRHHRRQLQKMRRQGWRRGAGQCHDGIREGDRGSWQCDSGGTEQKHGRIPRQRAPSSGKTGGDIASAVGA